MDSTFTPAHRGGGGPPIEGEIGHALLADAVEHAMDRGGFETAHIAGNSLGGYVALQLAARGRAESVVALAPAGGWARGDESYKDTLGFFSTMQELVRAAAPHAEAVLASVQGRRRATEFIATNFEHIPVELLAHEMRGAASCAAVPPLTEFALREGWRLDAEKIGCPVRIIWGTDDKILAWPSAAARFRTDWLPHADWVVLDGVGHCPQLDVPLAGDPSPPAVDGLRWNAGPPAVDGLLGAELSSCSAPSCAQPSIPALTPPAEAGAKGASSRRDAGRMLPFPAGRRERESRCRRHERSTS